MKIYDFWKKSENERVVVMARNFTDALRKENCNIDDAILVCVESEYEEDER
jgi:hypothetical protein